MNLENIERVLGLVRQELGCKNARLELGGFAPDDPRCLSTPLSGGFRLVAIFEREPEDSTQLGLKLRELAVAFFENTLKLPPGLPQPRTDARESLSRRRLGDELYALAGRTGAAGAFVIDLRSPIVWGCSEPDTEDGEVEWLATVGRLSEQASERHLDLAILSGLVETERSHLLAPFPAEERARLERLVGELSGRSLRSRQSYIAIGRGVLEIRRFLKERQNPPPSGTSLRHLWHGPEVGGLLRSFSGIYLLVLVFPGEFSELHVEAAALHALPLIERLVTHLPPVDPQPPQGKVLNLPTR